MQLHLFLITLAPELQSLEASAAADWNFLRLFQNCQSWRPRQRPTEIDFETAKDRGPGGVTATRARTTAGVDALTRGFAAPELLDNPEGPKSRASDMFALGVSITHLHGIMDVSLQQQHIPLDKGANLTPLWALVDEMCRNEPADRTTAQIAQQSPVFWVDSGSTVASQRAALGRPPPYWAQDSKYRWHPSPYMEKVVETLMKAWSQGKVRG